MSRLIIDNRAEISDAEAVILVSSVIKQGKISGKSDNPQYCYLSFYKIDDQTFNVAAIRNKNSDRFLITRSDW